MPRFTVDVADRVFNLVADTAMVDRRSVRDQAAVLIEEALGLRPRRERGERADLPPNRQQAEAVAS